ncbi:hypothetical protein [Lentzea sp. NPDC003310]|uniref:WXG100 family type VII secretion target n=1 Tax=Lentzea sp. NPDC003310 TaxID=3154447 RepID=UPI00339DFAA7
MPIETRVDGDPDAIMSVATWLRTTLSNSIYNATTRVHAARSESECDWTGAAADAFRAKMSSGGRKADELAEVADEAGRFFERCADDLRTVQVRMERTRSAARAEGLDVVGTRILEPGPTPPAAALQPDDGLATTHDQAADARRVVAYRLLSEEAAATIAAGALACDVLVNIGSDLITKTVFQAADLANGLVGGFAGQHVSVLKQRAVQLRTQAAAHVGHYLRSGGGSTSVAKYNNAAAYRANMAAMDAAQRAETGLARRIGAKVPVVGLVITAAGVGYDIHTGKPPGKAVVSGVTGLGASTGLGMAIGGPVGAAVGFVGGLVAGGLADAVWDRLPKTVTTAIDAGVKAVGKAVADVAGSIGRGARKIFDLLF